MDQKPDYIGTIIISTLLILLTIAGYLSYKSIDWTVLKRMEGQTLVLPTPITTTPSAGINNQATSSSQKAN